MTGLGAIPDEDEGSSDVEIIGESQPALRRLPGAGNLAGKGHSDNGVVVGAAPAASRPRALSPASEQRHSHSRSRSDSRSPRSRRRSRSRSWRAGGRNRSSRRRSRGGRRRSMSRSKSPRDHDDEHQPPPDHLGPNSARITRWWPIHQHGLAAAPALEKVYSVREIYFKYAGPCTLRIGDEVSYKSVEVDADSGELSLKEIEPKLITVSNSRSTKLGAVERHEMERALENERLRRGDRSGTSGGGTRHTGGSNRYVRTEKTNLTGFVKFWSVEKGMGYLEGPQIYRKYRCDLYCRQDSFLSGESVPSQGEKVFISEVERNRGSRDHTASKVAFISRSREIKKRTAAHRQEATVVRWFADEGFGFLESDDIVEKHGQPVFFHVDDMDVSDGLVAGSNVQAGTLVLYDEIVVDMSSGEGVPKAVGVRVRLAAGGAIASRAGAGASTQLKIGAGPASRRGAAAGFAEGGAVGVDGADEQSEAAEDESSVRRGGKAEGGRGKTSSGVLGERFPSPPRGSGRPDDADDERKTGPPVFPSTRNRTDHSAEAPGEDSPGRPKLRRINQVANPGAMKDGVADGGCAGESDGAHLNEGQGLEEETYYARGAPSWSSWKSGRDAGGGWDQNNGNWNDNRRTGGDTWQSNDNWANNHWNHSKSSSKGGYNNDSKGKKGGKGKYGEGYDNTATRTGPGAAGRKGAIDGPPQFPSSSSKPRVAPGPPQFPSAIHHHAQNGNAQQGPPIITPGMNNMVPLPFPQPLMPFPAAMALGQPIVPPPSAVPQSDPTHADGQQHFAQQEAGSRLLSMTSKAVPKIAGPPALQNPFLSSSGPPGGEQHSAAATEHTRLPQQITQPRSMPKPDPPDEQAQLKKLPKTLPPTEPPTKDCKKLEFSNIPETAAADLCIAFFRKAGKLTDFRFFLQAGQGNADAKSKKHLGKGLITYATQEQAKTAMHKLNNKVICEGFEPVVLKWFAGT